MRDKNNKKCKVNSIFLDLMRAARYNPPAVVYGDTCDR
jgi:hypothetical protein